MLRLSPKGLDNWSVTVLLETGTLTGASPLRGAVNSAEPLAVRLTETEPLGFGMNGSQMMISPLAVPVAVAETATSEPPSLVGV